MKKRLFVSIPLPDNFQEDFAAAMGKIQIPGVKWTSHENLHITLHFIGYVKEDITHALEEELERVIASVEPVELKFERATIAPPNKIPSMIWALFEDVGGGYKKLATSLIDALSEFGDNEVKEPIPHVTLARFDTPTIAQSINLEIFSPIAAQEFRVSRVELMESHLSQSGPIYTIIRSYEL